MDILTPGKKSSRSRSGASVKKEKKQKQSGKISNAVVLKFLILAGVISLCAYGVMSTSKILQTVSNQRVEQVLIEGEINYISDKEILAAVNMFVSESLLLVDMDKIKDELESTPWIRSVTISRQWPDTLVLSVDEEKAIARWGESGLLNQDGNIFSPANIAGLETLAILSGPLGSESKVMEQYLLFNQLLYPRELKIAELSLDERGAWKLMLANGVAVNVGKTAVMERMMRLVEFVDPSFVEGMASIEAIDLRYMSGIAVKNKSINSEEVVSL